MWPVVHFAHHYCDVYVGRPSKFGNPFRVGVDGTRSEVIAMYENWLISQPILLRDVCRELRGKILGCHCSPRECHADVLARIANNWQMVLPLEEI